VTASNAQNKTHRWSAPTLGFALQGLRGKCMYTTDKSTLKGKVDLTNPFW